MVVSDFLLKMMNSRILQRRFGSRRKRGGLPLALPLLILGPGMAEAQEKINFNDHVKAVLENKCFSCHNPDKKRGDLDLTSFSATMTGGGSGAIVTPGDAEASRLITTTTKKEEPFMPPEGAPLSAKEVEILSKWITGGVLETASSIAKKAAPKADLSLKVTAAGKPEGPVAMPEHVLLEPVVVTPRTSAVTALAASPWAPLAAISGQKQALLYHTETGVLTGVFPYPEGFIRSLKFSRSGSLLVAGGGQGGRKGNVVVWDVKSGRRVAEVGNEFDQVMAADVSPAQTMVALGGPSKAVKCFDLASGEPLYTVKKHTEWILALGFSPDGVLLASADRNGGVIVSEASNGAEFYVFETHKKACTGVAWRSDSNVLATCGEDGKVATYEMQEGKTLKSWDAHGGGCLSISFTPDGNVVTSGRDGMIRMWDVNGKKLKESSNQPDLVTAVAALHDSKSVVSGDWLGQVKVWNLTDKIEQRGMLSSNPPLIAQRIVESEKRVEELKGKVSAAENEAKGATDAVETKKTALEAARQTAANLAGEIKRLEGEVAAESEKQKALAGSLEESKKARNAEAEQWKQHEQVAARVKTLEGELTKLKAEREPLQAPEQAQQASDLDKKIQDVVSQLDSGRQALAKPPVALAEFDRKIKENQDQLTAVNNAMPGRKKSLEETKQQSAKQPAVIAQIEKELEPLTAGLTEKQNRLGDLKKDLDFQQKMPGMLRAAQFNVGLLAEREKLEKLDAEVKGLQEARKDTEADQVVQRQKIADNTRMIDEASAAMPGLEGLLAKLSSEQPAVEAKLTPIKEREAGLVGQVNAEKQKITGREGEIKKLEEAKNQRITKANQEAEALAKQVEDLKKALAEASGKTEGSAKDLAAKKQALEKIRGELETAKNQRAEKERLLEQAKGELKAREDALAAIKDQPEAVGPASQALETAKKALADAEAALNPLNAAVPQKEKELGDAGMAVAAAEKVLEPLGAAKDGLQKQMEEKNKALTAKRAEPAAAEQEFAAVAQPHRDEITRLKGVLEPWEKELAAVRDQLAAEQKIVVAAREAVNKAKQDVEAARKRIIDGKAALEAATRKTGENDKMLAEIQSELAKQEPQLGPLQEKVRQLNDQYFTMLPK